MPLQAASVWRITIRSQLRYCSRSSASWPRFLSTQRQSNGDRPVLFTARIPKSLVGDASKVIDGLKAASQGTQIFSPRDSGHDAAVVMATPGLTSLVGNESFSKNLASFLSTPGHDSHFSILSAVVDNVFQDTDPSESSYEGIAVLTGPLNLILPHLGKPEYERERSDHDTVGAMVFKLSSSSSVTVPLTRTIFHNGRPSTLFWSRFDLSTSAPRSIEQGEALRQDVIIPPEALSCKDPHLWLPLRSVTRARNVTESFGNILRRLDFEGKSSPASSELEANIGSIRKAILDASPQTETALPGVWGVVNPTPGQVTKGRNWNVHTTSGEASGNIVEAIVNGGRAFRLLSGGGGWGDKAGLLSLDPETSHFAASPEEEMQRLFGLGGDSDYVPVGSEVQFFIPELATNEPYSESEDKLQIDGIVFGISREAYETTSETVGATEVILTPGYFGAFSNEAIYISDEDAPPMKLSVPRAKLSMPSSN